MLSVGAALEGGGHLTPVPGITRAKACLQDFCVASCKDQSRPTQQRVDLHMFFARLKDCGVRMLSYWKCTQLGVQHCVGHALCDLQWCPSGQIVELVGRSITEMPVRTCSGNDKNASA